MITKKEVKKELKSEGIRSITLPTKFCLKNSEFNAIKVSKNKAEGGAINDRLI